MGRSLFRIVYPVVLVRIAYTDPLKRSQIEVSSLDVRVVGSELKRAYSQFDTHSLKHRLKNFADARAFRRRFEFESKATLPIFAGGIARFVEKLARFIRIVRIGCDVAFVCPIFRRKHAGSYSSITK